MNLTSIVQFFRSPSQSVAQSDTGWGNQHQNWNTYEGTRTDTGNASVKLELNQLSNSLERRNQMIVKAALNKLFTDSHFSICPINDVMELLAIGSRKSLAYKQLHALHCIHYKDMPKELVNEIPLMINELLTKEHKNHIATIDALKGVFSDDR